jgi:hypothetical protein
VKAKIVPTRYDLEAYRGDTLSIPLRALDAAGAPLDITSYTILAQVRRTRLATTVDAAFDVYVEDPLQGLYTIVLSPASWSAITCGETASDAASKYVWDAQLTSPSGEVSTHYAGAFVVNADVSRA